MICLGLVSVVVFVAWSCATEGSCGDVVFVDCVEADIGELMISQVDGVSVSGDGWLCSCVYPGAGVELKKGFIVPPASVYLKRK